MPRSKTLAVSLSNFPKNVAIAHPNPAPGEFLTNGNWTGDGLKWDSDFRQSGDWQAWGWDQVTEESDEPFLEKLNELAEILKRLRRWA